MARHGRTASSPDPGLGGIDGRRRGGRARVLSTARNVLLFGFVCVVLGAMVTRLVILMAGVHAEFGRAWLPVIAAGCAVSAGWAGLCAAAIWRHPGRNRAQWIAYAYALATIALMAPFFPKLPGTGYSFASKVPRGSSPRLLDWLALGAMAFAAAANTIALLALASGGPLSRLAGRRLISRAAASSVLSIPARLRDIGPAGPGPWRQGDLLLAPGSVTWSKPRDGATVDLTGALLVPAQQPGARVTRTRTVLILASAGRVELGIRPELFQELTMLADHFQPWRAQDEPAP